MRSGSNVLATGFSSGICRACTPVFLVIDVHVFAAAQREDRPTLLVNANAEGDGLLSVRLDVPDREPPTTDRPDNWERMLDTTVRGQLHVTTAPLPAMMARGSGPVYCTTQAAIEGITRGTRMDVLGKRGHYQPGPTPAWSRRSSRCFRTTATPRRGPQTLSTVASLRCAARTSPTSSSYPLDQTGSARTARREA